jgi:diadenylate cyclase
VNNFINLFDSFTLNDSVDILIVSFVLYRFFSIIQGTRALQVLVGTAFITTLYWFSLTFELYSLNWLLKSFFDYFFIIIIILFQEQIRLALALFGEAKIFGKKKKSYYDMQIEEVVAACSALSKDNTGALVIFERNHGLLNYSTTGTRLDAKIHSDLIYTLFQTPSPLHDGAIIIYQNRIQAAGCFLPLSKNIDLDRQFGTRHRAALGVSEVSDALVVIVSEETGKISICFNGNFYLCENENDLRKQLRMNLYSARHVENKKQRAA